MNKLMIYGSDIIFYIINEKNKIKKLFNIIDLNDNLIILHDNKKIYKKLIKIIEKNNIKKVAISNELMENKLIELIKELKINILDGRYLFKILCMEIVEYILNAKNAKIEETEISVLVNNLDNIIENNIINLAKRCKMLNIITNNSNKFFYISELLQNENGIIIRISKNKNKCLLKSNIIINFDFSEELLNECKFNEKSIVININEKLNINSKLFNGIIINYYEINTEYYENNMEYYKINTKYYKNNLEKNHINNKKLNKEFSKEILYESNIYEMNNLNEIRRKIKQDNIVIKNLIGVNEVINLKEFQKTS